MNVNDDYYMWLCVQTGLDISKNPRSSYTSLLEQLHHKDYRWLVRRDDNRGGDGLDLRYVFSLAAGETPELGECTMLELLIALSERMTFVLSDISEDGSHWFQVLLHNVGLLDYTNDVYSRDWSTASTVDNILNSVLDRKYYPDGRGGFYPLREPKEDQRTVELWYQMQAYAIEMAPR